MSTPPKFTPQQIQEQMARAETARQHNEISQADYYRFMADRQTALSESQAYYSRQAQVQSQVQAQPSGASSVVNAPVPQQGRFTDEQIVQQQRVAEQALNEGRISQAQYDLFMVDRKSALAYNAAVRADPAAVSALPRGSLVTGFNSSSGTITYLPPEQAKAYQESVSFYNAAGYPQYGGKYQALTLPQGAKVTNISETPKGLSYEYVMSSDAKQTSELPLTPAASRDYAVYESSGKFQGQVGGIPPSERFAWSNLTSVEKERVTAQTLKLAAGAAIVAAPFAGEAIGIGAGSVVLGQVSAPVIAQGIKFLPDNPITGKYQGTLLTQDEIVYNAALGGIFTTASGAVFKGGSVLASKYALPSWATSQPARFVGRQAVNVGLGAGGGYVLSGGDLTEAGRGAVLVGALGLVGEAGAGVARGVGVVKGRTQEFVAKQNVDALQRIDLNYREAYNQATVYRPAFKEQVLLKASGSSFSRPAVELAELKTIPTAPKNAYEYYSKVSTEPKQDLVVAERSWVSKPQDTFKELPQATLKELNPIYSGKEIVDAFSVKYDEPVLKEFKVEKPLDTGSSRDLTELALYQQTEMQTSFSDAGTVFYGKSQSPEAFYAKGPAKPPKGLADFEVGKVGDDYAIIKAGSDSLAFKKAQAEITREKQTPSMDKVLEPSKMMKEGALIGQPRDVEPYRFSGLKREALTFSKPQKVNTSELGELIKTDKIKLPEISKPVLGKTKAEVSEGEFWYKETNQIAQRPLKPAEQNQNQPFNIDKGRINLEIAKEISQTEPNLNIPTGTEKVIAEYRTQSSTPSPKAQEAAQNPFLKSRTRPYYTVSQAMEEEVTYSSPFFAYPIEQINLPGNVVLQRRNKDLTVQTGQQDNLGSMFRPVDLSVPFSRVALRSKEDAQPKKKAIAELSLNDGVILSPLVDSVLESTQDQQLKQSPIIFSDTSERIAETPLVDETSKITTQPMPIVPFSKPLVPFVSGGGKFEGGRVYLPRVGRRQRIRSYKRTYPTLVGTELLGITRKGNKRKKKP